MLEFKIPPVGENIESGTVVSIAVKPGDTVKQDQDLLELETDKATIPVPCPADGVIKDILIKAGDNVTIGQVVMTIDSASTGTASSAPQQDAKPSTDADKKQETAPAPQASTPPSGNYDTKLLVVGAGPGGYAAAFYAADLGMDVTLVDKESNPGGVCLYRGCIPSKALLHAARVLSESREAEHFGVTFSKPNIDIDKLRDWKNGIVSKLTGGLGQLTKQRKISFIKGTCRFTSAHEAAVIGEDGKERTLTFENAILATGSSPIKLPNLPDSPRILDSTGALDLENIPKSLLLVGAGYIGLELGTAYAEFGAKVSVVEMMSGIIPGADRDLAMVLHKRLKTVFSDIMVSTKVVSMEETADGIKATFEDEDGKSFDHTYEKILVAVGRRPNSKGLGLEETGVELDQKGFVTINDQRQTSVPSIYAIGDVAGNPMLAHKASHEGRVAVEAISGQKVAFEPSAIPAVVFTDPEIAWCGITETEAKEQGRTIKVVKFPWGASGRALTLNRTDGLTKLIIDPDTERILGMAIVGVGAGELISEGALAIEMGSVAGDLKLTIHPHPTISETIMESAESFFGHSTHIYRPKKN